jgi:hypothetical protein
VCDKYKLLHGILHIIPLSARETIGVICLSYTSIEEITNLYQNVLSILDIIKYIVIEQGVFGLFHLVIVLSVFVFLGFFIWPLCYLYLWKKYIALILNETKMGSWRTHTSYNQRQFVAAQNDQRGRRCRVRMVVGFTTTYAINAYHHWCCEFESRSWWGVQHYVIQFVSDLRQVGGFLRVLRFPPSIKLSATI